jgi:S-formylglutathione hydrolase FrmB
MRITRVIAVAILLLGGIPGLAEGRVECAALKSTVLARNVRYCAALPAGYDGKQAKRFPVVYYLHGLGESEQTLVGALGAMLGDLQRNGKIKEFLVITPDAGTTFYINSRDGRVRYEDFLVREFIPAMERRFRVAGTRATRGIAGTSMGGYGALRTAFKYPQLFAAVEAEMPALYEKFPQRLLPFFEMSRRGGAAGGPFGQPFDEAFWERNTPFTLARENAARLRNLKIYFDCGSEDDYGFDAGTRKLDQLLTSLGIKHEAHIYPGRHSPDFVADHFPAALTFVSNSLGGK